MRQPPYERMRSAERQAQGMFPEATNVKALWTPGSEHDIAVEVSFGRSRRVLPVVARA
jgi:hypothetical protein